MGAALTTLHTCTSTNPKVEVCYAKDSQGIPTYRVACPTNMLSDDYDNSCVTESATDIFVASLA